MKTNTSTITVKGQVTVPKPLRDAFGWKPGDQVAFLRERDGVKLVRATRKGRGSRIVEQLRRVHWKRGLSTNRLMALTRGDDR
jgi:AbrB family looped-hinge helix DNA binding protein